jgi:uncharacterized protein with FMN-binding domain
MKRSVLVAAGTAVGVTAVVSYHATGPSVGPGLVGPAAASSRSSATHTRHPRHRARTHHHTTSSGASGQKSGATTASSSATSGATRSALGHAVSYPYGELQVKVSEQGSRITDVSVVRLSVPDPQSGSIDQIAVPQLRQEVLAAQGLNINGVSGASYTSQAYAQSVQSALDKLG